MSTKSKRRDDEKKHLLARLEETKKGALALRTLAVRYGNHLADCGLKQEKPTPGCTCQWAQVWGVLTADATFERILNRDRVKRPRVVRAEQPVLMDDGEASLSVSRGDVAKEAP